MNASKITLLVSIAIASVCAVTSAQVDAQPNASLTTTVAKTPISPAAYLANNVHCPEEIQVAGGRIPNDWSFTPSAIKLVSATMPNADTMYCNYDNKIYGNPILIWRWVKPQYKSCVARDKGFRCEKA
jgi:hypothetical protein